MHDPEDVEWCPLARSVEQRQPSERASERALRYFGFASICAFCVARARARVVLNRNLRGREACRENTSPLLHRESALPERQTACCGEGEMFTRKEGSGHDSQFHSASLFGPGGPPDLMPAWSSPRETEPGSASTSIGLACPESRPALCGPLRALWLAPTAITWRLISFAVLSFPSPYYPAHAGLRS